MTHIALPTLISDGDTNHEGHHDIIHQALNSGAVNQGIFEGPAPWVDLSHPTYGTVGDGVIDDSVGEQLALNALATTGGTLFVPGGKTFRSTVALTFPTHAIHVQGVSFDDSSGGGSTLVNAASDMWSVTVQRYRLTFSNICMISEPGGGHIFNVTGGIAYWGFQDVALVQNNAAKNAWRSSSSMLSCTWRDFVIVGAPGRTFAMFYAHDPGGAISCNRWENVTTYGTDTDTEYHFDIGNDAAVGTAASSHNYWVGCVGEVPRAGWLQHLGLTHSTIDGIRLDDFVSATTKHLIRFAAGAGGTTSNSCNVEGFKAYGRALGGGLYDINVESGGDIHFDDVQGTVNLNGTLGNSFGPRCNFVGGITVVGRTSHPTAPLATNIGIGDDESHFTGDIVIKQLKGFYFDGANGYLKRDVGTGDALLATASDTVRFLSSSSTRDVKLVILTGLPNGSKVGDKGDIGVWTGGAAGAIFWIKTTDTVNTGWVALA